jgi:NADH-quinone oxidoreductase subunit L
MSQFALWMLVLLPAVVGGVFALSRRLEPVAAAVSLSTAAVTAALSVLVAVEQPTVAVPFMAGSDLGLGVDPLAGVVVPTIAIVTVVVLVFSAADIHESGGRFHGLMLLFASSALATAAATTLPTLLLAWEVMGATSYALVGFWWREEHRVSAGLTAFVTTRTADLGLYVAAGAALAGGAGLALDALPQSSDGWRQVVAAGVLVAALGKAAQLPFSFWLSRAMEGPSPVSALLHSAAMVAMGGYLLLRTEPLLASVGWAAPATAWAGALTALILGMVAVAQRDLKQLLAASTSAQLGFVVMAAGLGSVGGGAAHLVGHASTKALLFLAAGAWLTALGTKRLCGLRGVAHRWRVVAWSSTVGLLALAGVAPLALWATKDAVLAAALAESPWLYGLGLAAAALSAAYAGKVLVVVWRGVPDADRTQVDSHLDEEGAGTRAVPALQQAPLVVLAAGATALGLLAVPPLGDMVAHALGEGSGPHATALEMAASAAIAVIVVLAVWRWGIPEPRWTFGWLGMERAAHATVVRPTLRLAGLLARFDDRVLDRAVEALAAATLRSAGRAGSADHRWVDGAVEGLAEQSRRLGRLARRPQTGQLYQYYIQAIVVLAVGFLLLVTVR